MTQRTRTSTAFALIAAAGFVMLVGTLAFGVVKLRHLAAAETTVAVVREQATAADPAQPQPAQPQSVRPVPQQQPLSAARSAAAPLLETAHASLRRVPEFSEMEAKAEAALNTPITVRFEESDLKSVLEKLSELAGVSVRTAAQEGMKEALQNNNAEPVTLDIKGQPLKAVIADVYKAAFDLSYDSLGPGIRLTAAPTENGIEVGVAGHGVVDERETRVYVVGHLLRDPEDTRRIINLLYDKAGGYWIVSADGSVRGVRAGGMTMTVADDNDVYFMAQFAGSIVHLESLGALVVNANPQAHFEIVRTLRLLDEVSRVAAAG